MKTYDYYSYYRWPHLSGVPTIITWNWIKEYSVEITVSATEIELDAANPTASS